MPLWVVGSESRSTWRLPVLVASAEGYKNLCRLVTRMKLRAPKGEGALTLEEFEGFTTGLVALAGRPLLDARHHGVGGLLDRLVGLFGRGNVCVELQRHLLRDEECENAALIELARGFRVPIIATNDVRCATPADRPLFDVLTCVRHHTTLDAAGRRLARNAERYLKSPEMMAELFSDLPEAIAGTQALAERLEYTMADLGYRFPIYPVPPGETAASFLRHMTEVGARDRYRPYHDKARAQISRELDLIEKLDLAGYFLIVWDIVNYCRQQDILVQGRGSAANSAVCYSLGITAVDPIKMELLFERFLSEERGEWPDIDLDLPSGDRRERVIQHVYEKYGQRGAAMTANVITYRGKSAAREVGKALSLDEERIDRLAKVMHAFEFTDPNETLARNMEAAGLSLDMPRVRAFAELWMAIQDLPRHLGQHSGGMVVSQGELDSVVPLEPASMPGRVVIQWDKDDCAEMGIVKVDLLGLGMMAVLAGRHRAGEYVGQRPDSETPNSRSSRAQSREPRAESPIRSRASAPRRSRRLRDAAEGRDHRRLPGRVARADGDAPAAQADALLRPRRGGRDHPSRSDRRADGASVSQSAGRQGRSGAAASVASSRCSGARSACRSFRSSCFAWRWWPRDSRAVRPKSCVARWASSVPRNG